MPPVKNGNGSIYVQKAIGIVTFTLLIVGMILGTIVWSTNDRRVIRDELKEAINKIETKYETKEGAELKFKLLQGEQVRQGKILEAIDIKIDKLGN